MLKHIATVIIIVPNERDGERIDSAIQVDLPRLREEVKLYGFQNITFPGPGWFEEDELEAWFDKNAF